MANYFPAFAGLLSGANPDEETPFGVPASDVRMAQAGLLGNIGATLLAAGQRISPADRARLLAQIGPQTAQFSTDIYNAAQRRYQQGMLQEAQARRAEEAKQRAEEAQQRAQMQEERARLGAMLQPTGMSEVEGGELKPVPSAYGEAQVISQFMKAYPEEGAKLFAEMMTPPKPTAPKEPPAAPASIREYEYYVSAEKQAGRTPVSYPDFLKLGKPDATEAARVQADQNRLIKVQESFDTLDKLRAPIAEAERMIKEGKLTTGFFGELNRIGGSILPGLGIGSEEQYFRSLATQLAPAFKLPGAVTEYEMNLYMQAAPNLGDTKEANLLKINLINRMIDQADKKAEFIRNNLGSPTLYEDMRKQFSKPILSEDETKMLQDAITKGQQVTIKPGTWSVRR
jgi:hypothetical protein